MSRRTIAVVSLLFLTVSCGGVEEGGKAAERKEPASAGGMPKASAETRLLVLPFDRYVLSLKEHYTVSDASDLLIEKCMRKKGYEWKSVERPPDAVDVKNRRRYGVVESAVAEKFGYHAPEELMNPYEVKEREASREKELSPGAKTAALSGDGCAVKADERLSGGREPDYDKLSEIDARIFEKSQKVPEVERAMEAWSACMREKGFDYDKPAEAVNDARWWSKGSSDESAAASRRERATASADVRCKDRTGLVGLWFSAEKRLEREQVEKTPEFFRELASVKKENLRNARAVIGRG
ncbi:hypothetical protein [Streptomyces sp. WMMB 322]|uniref:hypothetical protein n=1 Tax=Streptomyces sp. WMMB 322 TaxID=1286821 RepID=UPI0006E3C03C|nr:hypothetical protein [Streptomyces sp. WMMB 322]SCK13319.1 hypothetical protein H180DRAFT_00811 [Streptomyces sp. WMMB 322]